MTDFTNHLHSRYLLRFEPKNPRPGMHQVRVRLRQPAGCVVLARRSYWVEESGAHGALIVSGRNAGDQGFHTSAWFTAPSAG